jgi:hypothetical protein
MTHIALQVDGILRDPINDQPTDHGRLLYRALTEVARVTLMAHKLPQSWLALEGFTAHHHVVYASIPTLAVIKTLRAQGPLALAVISEPDLTHDLFDLGQAHLLYVSPRIYTSLPDRPQWKDLVAKIDADRARAAQVLISAPEEEAPDPEEEDTSEY